MVRRESTKVGQSAIPRWWSRSSDEVLSQVGSGVDGLTGAEAARRLDLSPYPIGRQMSRDVELMVRQFRSPILLILTAAAAVSQLLGERVDAVIIGTIVVVSGGLGFVQERGAVRTVHSLMTSVQVHCQVVRDGRPVELRVREIVRGDVVILRAGDIIPGDCLVILSNDLVVDESALTGEAYPRRKRPGPTDPDAPLVDRYNAVHLGTHVMSGEARVVVIDTGMATEFGGVVAHLAARHVPTAFERGVTRFGFLLLQWTAILVLAVFAVNVVLHRPVVDALLFSLALAVGLTPQMLPAIVTLSMSKGATQLAHQRVIVKRLEAIEDIGGIDVLCTDKTGTLTVGAVALDRAEGIDGCESVEVARMAALNSYHQTGFPNPIDEAILVSTGLSGDVGRRITEIPYDFDRKRLTVVIEVNGARLLITKGAIEKVLECCASIGGRPVSDVVESVRRRVTDLSALGMRVMGVAVRVLDGADRGVTPPSESGLDFVGLLAFLDPPKPGAREAVDRLAGLNVETRLVTGDHRLAARHMAEEVGIRCDRILTGGEIERLDENGLIDACRTTAVFAEVTPIDKERVVRAIASLGHAVAFLGDGINDAPALHAADVGISVDTAVDVAKEAADIVLLDKDLAVIGDGIEQGRRIFANTLKYVYVTTSANFGNMLSMAAAALFLPFLPLLPAQILLLNFLSDIPGTTIATDRVDPEQLATSRHWDISSVRTFMIVFGLTSAVFDLMTFVLLRWVFGSDAIGFRSGWFVESTITELAAMLVLRTSRPFFRSRPSRALVVSSLLVFVVTVTLPFSPMATALGLAAPALVVVVSLIGVTVGYVLATEYMKRRFPGLVGVAGVANPSE